MRVTPNVTYAQHLRVLQEAFPLSSEARRRVLGETARKIWFRALKI
jgi:hypothetical protein